MASKVVSLRLREQQVARLERAARRLGRTPSETAALLLEEALRLREHALIEFRDSPVGRQAYLHGSRLAVWQVAALVRSLGEDPAHLAAHLDLPLARVQVALRYAAEYPEEIRAAIDDSRQAADTLDRLVPGLVTIQVDAPSS